MCYFILWNKSEDRKRGIIILGKQSSGFVYRFMVMIIGAAVMGAGCAMAVSTTLGGDPLAWVWEALTYHLPITLLIANLIVSFLLLIPPIIWDRQQIGLGTVFQPIVLGVTCSLFLRVISGTESNYVVLVLGLAIMGIGAGIYNSVNLGRGSYDCCVFLMSNSLNKSIGTVRVVCDFILCAIALLLTHRLAIGPIIAIFCIGPIMNASLKILNNVNNLFLTDRTPKIPRA